MTTDEKIEKLARAVRQLADLMAGPPHQPPTGADFADRIVLEDISREMAEMLKTADQEPSGSV